MSLSGAPEGHRGERHRILVVDDDLANRLTLVALLEDSAYAVDEADSAEHARRAWASAHYDIILLDRHLGDVDGLSLLPDLKASLPHAKVVLLSGSIEGEPTGVDATFEKGQHFDLLLQRLRDLPE